MTNSKELEIKAHSLAAQATDIRVIDQASYDAADALSAGAKAILKAMDESYDPVIKAAHEAHKAAVKAKKDQYEPVETAMKTINAKMSAWYRAEQARKAEIQRQLDEAARKKAEDAQIEAAEMLESMGMNEAADEALEAKPVIQKVEVKGPEKGDGVFYRDAYSAEVEDFVALVKAVAEGRADISCLLPNDTVLNQLARALKDNFKVPGVRVVKNSVMGRR
jgi:nucleotide-binding universal stress UspA family protein